VLSDGVEVCTGKVVVFGSSEVVCFGGCVDGFVDGTSEVSECVVSLTVVLGKVKGFVDVSNGSVVCSCVWFGPSLIVTTV